MLNADCISSQRTFYLKEHESFALARRIGFGPLIFSQILPPISNAVYPL